MEEVKFCISYLKAYNHIFQNIDYKEEDTFRALMNITMPYDLSDEYYKNQDKALIHHFSKLKITDVNTLPFIQDKISLYQGDITLLKADAIVNACNEKLLGCFSPLHSCIDNQIHSYAGLQVRRDLMKVMDAQGHDEPNGGCKATKGYNLPASYIFHTVGPKAFGRVSDKEIKDLQNCYLSCLKKAEEMKLESIVFCSISTGVYGFPKVKAAQIAYQTVREFLKKNTTLKRVVFNVFSEDDYGIYDRTIKNFAK